MELETGTASPLLILFLANMTNWLASATIIRLEKYPTHINYSGCFFVSLRSAPVTMGTWRPLSGCGVLGSGSPAASTSGVYHRRPPIPPPGPGLAGSVFLNRERSDSPLRFQNRPWPGGGRRLTLKALFKQVFQLTTDISCNSGLMKYFIWASKCAVFKNRNCALTSGLAKSDANHLPSFKQFHADWAACFEHPLLQGKSILMETSGRIVMCKSSLHLFWINCPGENKQEKDLEGIKKGY